MSERIKKTPSTPRVGVGVVIKNADGKILIGKRIGSHAAHFSIPGGKLDMGETFENCAKREILEETGLTIYHPRVICVSNNLRTYAEEGVHYISIGLLVITYSGELQIMEPEKCDGWQWADPRKLPQPHFDASETIVRCYLQNELYHSPDE